MTTDQPARERVLLCGARPLDLSHPRVMGVLNVTPDSFSDGGHYVDLAAARERALRMQEEGAAIIDVGGESTRPGADPVPLDQELERVVPVIEAIAGDLRIPVSVDTCKPQVMRAAVAAGAGLINDVTALRAPGALEAAASLGVPVCLMHMQGEPRTMQEAPRYANVVDDVRSFLAARIKACVETGIPRDRLLVDPGFGFGKNLDHNLDLLGHLEAMHELDCPLLVGVSRKSMFKALLGAELNERLPGSLAAAVMAVERGACVIRSHDVWQTCHALKTWQAVRERLA